MRASTERTGFFVRQRPGVLDAINGNAERVALCIGLFDVGGYILGVDMRQVCEAPGGGLMDAGIIEGI